MKVCDCRVSICSRVSTDACRPLSDRFEGSDHRRRHPLKALFLKQLAEVVSDFRMVDVFRPGYKETQKGTRKRLAINRVSLSRDCKT